MAESYKSYTYWTPFSSLFSSYPSLVPVMPPPKVSKQLSQAQVDDILSIGKSIRATKYDDRLEQRTFLDAKVLQLVRVRFSCLRLR